MKGNAPIIAGFAIFLVTTIVLARTIHFSIGDQIEHNANLAEDSSSNEFLILIAKSYLETALKYSFIDACSKPNSGQNQNALDKLEKDALGTLNSKTSFGSKILSFRESLATLPLYDSVFIEKSQKGAIVTAKAGMPLESRAENKIQLDNRQITGTTDILRDDSTINVQIETDCLEKLGGLQQAEFTRAAQDMIKKELSKWPESGIFQEAGTVAEAADLTFSTAAANKGGVPDINTIADGQKEIERRIESMSVDVDGKPISLHTASVSIKMSQCSSGDLCKFSYRAAASSENGEQQISLSWP